MSKNNSSIFHALKYLALALPLLFIAPIVVTIGFKALKSEQTYFLLIIGIILIIVAIISTALGVLKVSNYLFNNDKD